MRLLALWAACALAAPAAPPDPIDATVQALYQVISGPAGTRDWARFRTLFAEGARLIAMRPAGPAVLTPEDYIQRAGANFAKAGFYESEIARRVEAYGAIAHVFSTYEGRHAPGEKPFVRGINSFQLVRTADGWKVLTILWDAERPDQPIPPKYLPPAR